MPFPELFVAASAMARVSALDIPGGFFDGHMQVTGKTFNDDVRQMPRHRRHVHDVKVADLIQ
jgi:hypothetical protein